MKFPIPDAHLLDSFERTFSRHLRLWTGMYAIVVLLFIIAALYTLSVSFWRGPWRDMWEALPFVEKAIAGQATLADYWDQYGYSHRPLLSRAFWVADFRWFSASNYLLLGVSLVMQAVIYLTLRAVVRRDNSFTAMQRCVLWCSVLFCLYNITQVFNFLHTFDVQWFLVTGFVVLSVERVLASADNRSAGILVVAWLCVLVASLNNFSALVIWPVEILLLIALRCPAKHIAGFSAATFLYLLLYFYGLPTGGGSLSVELLQQPWPQIVAGVCSFLVVFPLWYLSNPLSFQLSMEGPLHMPLPVSWLAPTGMGILLLCVFYAWYQAFFQRKKFSAVAWMGLTLALYGYGVGVVTALGRALFWDNVYALRYQNIVLLFWIGIVLWLAASVRWRHLGLFAGAVLLLLVFTVNVGWYHELILKTGNRTRDAHLALVVGLERHLSAIQATVSRSHLHDEVGYTLQHEAQFLRDIHAGPYADPAWSVPDFAVLQSLAACDDNSAQVDVRGDDDSYARLSIVFDAPQNHDLIAWFDTDKKAPGLLVAMRADTFVARLQQSINGFTDYAGFAKTLPQQPPETVFAYQGTREGGYWCRLVVK